MEQKQQNIEQKQQNVEQKQQNMEQKQQSMEQNMEQKHQSMEQKQQHMEQKQQNVEQKQQNMEQAMTNIDSESNTQKRKIDELKSKPSEEKRQRVKTEPENTAMAQMVSTASRDKLTPAINFTVPGMYITPEEAMFIRLAYLVLKIGTLAVRRFFDAINHPDNLNKKIEDNKEQLEKLHGKGIITKDHMKVLFPAKKHASSKYFDILLMMAFLRYISGLKSPKSGWNRKPPPSDCSPEADLARIKYYRNLVAHAPSITINTDDFTHMWEELSQAIIRLGGEDFKSKTTYVLLAPLDPNYYEFIRALSTIADYIPVEILEMDEQSIEIYKKALKAGKEPDHTIRLMVVGPQGVGKTTLINRLLKLGLNCAEIESTNGIDIHVHRSAVNVLNGKWIFNEDEVTRSTDPDSRLVRILKQYQNKMTNSGMEENMEKKRGMEEETETLSSIDREYDDETKVLTGAAEETVLFKREETTPAVKENDDTKIDEDILNVISAAISTGISYDIFGKISVWDFGGDFIFYTTHQTFLSPRAIYLVVFDITKTLLDEFNDPDCYVDISGLKYLKMGEYLVFWLNSIHTYASGDKDGVPPVILVATHLDKVKGDKESEKEQQFDKIREYLMENGMSLYAHLDDEDFGVDNTESADDSVFEELRQKIFEVAKAQKYWGEEKPANWITFEKLLLEKKDNGIKLLSFEQVMKLNNGMGSRKMDQDQELNVFLKFQHAIGNLIYFSDLNDYVVLDPKWLIDAFSCLITHEKFQEKKWKHDIKLKWKTFSVTAELEKELINALWKDIEEKQRKHLLGLMNKLDIIAKPRINKETADSNSGEELDYYFVPLMLKEKITDDQLQGVKENACPTPNMYFVFKNHFLSPSVFHRLIAACMKKWDVACNGNKKLLFCGCGIFNMDQSRTTRIMISMDNYRIKVCVFHYHSETEKNAICSDDVSKSVAIRKFVEETLKIIFGRYQQIVLYELQIECSEGGLTPVENLKKYQSVNCCAMQKKNHVSLSRKLLQYWFHPEEYQNSVDTDGGKDLSGLPFGYDDRCPTEKQLFYIATKIGYEYFRLAIELGIKADEIHAIEHNYPNDCCRQCFEVLLKWKRQHINTTMESLYKAMREAECDVQVLISACREDPYN